MNNFNENYKSVEKIGWVHVGRDPLPQVATYESGLSGYMNREKPFDYNAKLVMEDGKPKLVLRITKYGEGTQNDPLTMKALHDFYTRFLKLVPGTRTYFEVDTPLDKFKRIIRKLRDINTDFIQIDDGKSIHYFEKMADVDLSFLEIGRVQGIANADERRKELGLSPRKPYGDVKGMDDTKRVTEFLFSSGFDVSDVFELSIGGQRLTGGQEFVDTHAAKMGFADYKMTPRLEELGGSFSFGKINAGMNSELVLSLGQEFVEFKDDKVGFKNKEAEKLVRDILKVYGFKLDFIA